jgi:hypothetical protein
LARAGVHRCGMDEKRPPDIDAEYRVVHGPWPRWALQLGLARLALWTALVVVALMAVAVGVAWLLHL